MMNLDENALVLDVLEASRQPGVMIDVGAHGGSTALPFLEHGWRVVGLEPNPERHSRLRQLSAEYDAFTLLTCAAGKERSEAARFYTSTESSGISSLVPFRDSHADAGAVPVRTLRDILEEIPVDRVDYLKVDVEGFDLHVLQGFPFDRFKPKAVMAEFEDLKTKHAGYSFDDLGNFLLDQGYAVYVSEWAPIERYGGTHRWRKIKKYPCTLDHPDAWGNFIAVLPGRLEQKLSDAAPNPAPKPAPNPAPNPPASVPSGRVAPRASSPKQYPRVLVLSTSSFNPEAGGGVTMSNLFRGWPKDRIAQIYSYGVKNKDMSVCQTYYHIPGIHKGTATLEGRFLYGSGPMSRAARRFGLRKLVGLSSQFQEAIAFARQFKPDVAYCRPMDKPSAYWWFCRDLCKLLDIPYVTHIMDDWPARYIHDARSGGADGVPPGIRGAIKSRRMDRSMRRLINDASANIAISPEMAAGFYERYGQRFLPFHNTIDVERWERLCKPRPGGRAGTDRPFVIRYIGAVVPDKEMQSLKDIAAAVRALHQQGRKIRMEIHCGPAWTKTVDEQLADGKLVVRGRFLGQDDLPGALSEADLLVLPVNFDERSMQYVGYSMQTKGPEYMASGTPVLVYGPASNPNVRYARDAGWAVTVDERSEDGSRLADEIRKLMDDPGHGARLSDRGRETVRANHDARMIRDRFLRTIADAAEGGSRFSRPRAPGQ